MTWRKGLHLIAVGVLALCANEARSMDLGEFEYRNSCAQCHGLDGTGNGPMADQLNGKPSDLTVLAKNNGGNFPYQKVYRTIDGTYNEGSFRAHGSKEMPIWGDVFRRKASSENRYMESKGRMMAIIQYIETMQKK